MNKLLLKTTWDAEGIFRERPNRFLGIVDLNEEFGGPGQGVHIHDPGRLQELLYPGNRVALKRSTRPGRKTGWTLMAARHQTQWILVNSGLHRQISHAVLTDPDISPLGQADTIQAEINFGRSRLDYRIVLEDGSVVYVEVKGCTLSENRVALFPDAPTSRGLRHIHELMEIKTEGERAAMLILVFRQDIDCFSPNGKTDPKFATAFYQAVKNGVEVYPMVCSCNSRGIWFEKNTVLCTAPA